jgi:peptide deformylase
MTGYFSMPIITILQYPDPKLRRKGITVNDFGDVTQKIIDDMFETHYAATNCAALAATQLDIANAPHITVIDFSESKDQPLCLVNGKIVHREGSVTDTEGCMSVGGGSEIFSKVKRSEKIKVVAQDRHGENIEFEADGFMAKCVQHELDHLDGKLYIDLLSPLRKNKFTKDMKKLDRKKDQ